MSNRCTNSIFGNIRDNGIRFYQNSLIAAEGSDMVQKMMLSSVFSPYEQVLRGKITLKAGKCKYLLNHLGLGDNATFLSIVASYDDKSKIESQNFVQYSYYTSPNNWYSFAQMMLLTGNSENRIEQLYLTNPNKNHKVTLDIMVGIIDDESGFFENLCDSDEIAANNVIKFTNLRCDDIITWVPNETIAILNAGGVAQAFININDINSVTKDNNIITINDRSVGTIILEFIDDYHATQALSILSWILEDPSRITQELDDVKDNQEPTVIFTGNVYKVGESAPSPAPLPTTWNNCPVEAYDIADINYTPSVGDPANSKMGDDFEALPLSLSLYGGNISKEDIGNHVISCIIDNRDGEITVTTNNLLITDSFDNIYLTITSEGDYVIKVNIDDIAENDTDINLNVIIEIIS